MRIIFMGTPEFAVPALDALAASQHEVLAVVTVPDKPKGRGQGMAMSDVKKRALELGLPVLQPVKLKDPVFINSLKTYNADIFVVIAFRILPPEVYELPKYGAINAHASLLPKYRGAAPIHWAIFNGETETGITIFQITKGVDTGNIIAQTKIPIGIETNTGELYNLLKHSAAQTLKVTLGAIENNIVKYIKQDDTIATPAPKVHPDTGKLDFTRTGDELCRTVRAFTPWPGAYFILDGQRIKVARSGFEPHAGTIPGKIELLSKKQFAIHCRDGYFLPLELQSPGRKMMDIVSWLNGADLTKIPKTE